MLDINKDILKKVLEFFKDIPIENKINGMFIKKFILANIDIKQEFDRIISIYPQLNNYGNLVYLIRHNLDPDIVLFCKICHKPLKLTYGLGAKKMAKYCSAKCSSNDNLIKEKRQNTNIKKYRSRCSIKIKINFR